MEERLVKVDLTGKTALVTGASRGIGEAIATALAENGAAVAVNYLTSEARASALVERVRANRGKAAAVEADVSVPEQAQAMVRQAEDALGAPIDILVNNAGSQVALSTIETLTPELWQRVLALNLTAAMVCAKCVVPGMKQKGWGRIVNISSISARSGGGPGGIPYATSKGGLSAFTKGLAKELGPTGITVNAIAPGVILTDIHKRFSTKEDLDDLRQRVPLLRFGRTEEVAGAVLFLASDSASYITGETLAVNGGLRMD